MKGGKLVTVFKCKMCGAILEIGEENIAVCAYCGTQQTLSKVHDDQRAAAFNRGNHFRRIGEFDRALIVYEQIVHEDATDAEAHWCCALCRFGVEYVKDPATGEYLPTCHRVSYESFLDDADYQAALKYSTGTTLRQYRKDGAKIAEVQQAILETSRSAEDYDVFICYKESDEKGNRTHDSLLAQEIYYRLTEEGRNVFFSRITLEEVVGKAYEPYIFAALHSARVMIVVGTRAEYLDAVWVRNEWSRFLAMMKKDPQKLLIPCYRDMSPYDMPDQLSVLQSYDMSKIGFTQDLSRSVAKVLDTQKMDLEKKTAPLLKRAFLFLEDGDWQAAEEYCEKILSMDAESAHAYLGKLMAQQHVRTQENLKYCAKSFETDSNYQNLLRFADDALRDTVAGYIAAIAAREHHPQLKEIYQNAVYSEAVKLMSGTRLSNYQEALEKLEAIGDWKDSSVRIAACRKKIAELKAQMERQAQEEQAAPAGKQKHVRILIAVAIIAVAAVIAAAIITVVIPDRKYDEALALMDAGQYTEAIAAFAALDGYKDSNIKITECEAAMIENRYQAALALQDAGSYTEAIAAFFALGDYKDSGNKIAECEAAILDNRYQAALALLDAGRYTEAIAAFEALSGYKDSAEKIAIAQFQIKVNAIKSAQVGDYVVLGSYEQDNNKENGKEDIEWRVLDIKDGKALVLSKYALDLQPLNVEYADITWETSTLRRWLNEDFLDKAFTDAEKVMIPTVTVPAHRHPDLPMADPGNPTQDQIFALSFVEVLEYLPSDDILRCAPTEDLKTKMLSFDYDDVLGCSWWLRTPCSETTYLGSAVIPLETGGFMRPLMNGILSPRMGVGVDNDLPVRPAMWIDMGD